MIKNNYITFDILTYIISLYKRSIYIYIKILNKSGINFSSYMLMNSGIFAGNKGNDGRRGGLQL